MKFGVLSLIRWQGTSERIKESNKITFAVLIHPLSLSLPLSCNLTIFLLFLLSLSPPVQVCLFYRLFRVLRNSLFYFLLLFVTRMFSLGYSLERSRPPLYFLSSFFLYTYTCDSFTLSLSFYFLFSFTFHVLQLHQLDSIISSLQLVMKRGKNKAKKKGSKREALFSSTHTHRTLSSCGFTLSSTSN